MSSNASGGIGSRFSHADDLRIGAQHIRRPKTQRQQGGIRQLVDLRPNLTITPQHGYSGRGILQNQKAARELKIFSLSTPVRRQLKLRHGRRNQFFHARKRRVFLPRLAEGKIRDVGPALPSRRCATNAAPAASSFESGSASPRRPPRTRKHRRRRNFDVLAVGELHRIRRPSIPPPAFVRRRARRWKGSRFFFDRMFQPWPARQ